MAKSRAGSTPAIRTNYISKNILRYLTAYPSGLFFSKKTQCFQWLATLSNKTYPRQTRAEFGQNRPFHSPLWPHSLKAVDLKVRESRAL